MNVTHNQKAYILFVVIGFLLLTLTLSSTTVLAKFGDASIFLNPDRSRVGEKIEVSGSGFHPGVSVYLFFSSHVVDYGLDMDDVRAYDYLTSASSSSTGEFITSFVVPDTLRNGREIEEVTGGTYYVYASYERNGNNIVESKEFYTRYISLDPEEGNTGDTIEICGGGFRARNNIRIEYDDEEIEIISGDTETDREGFFCSGIVIPFSDAGAHPIVVDIHDKTKEDFIVKPKLAFAPNTGEIGDELTVSGDGFGRNKELTVYINDLPMSPISERAETSDHGSFDSLKFKLPAQAAGTYKIKVRDSAGNSVTPTADFVLANTVSMKPLDGNVGTTITISGAGLAPGSTVIVKYDDEETGKTIVNFDAGFSMDFGAPASGGGDHVITISGANTNQQFTFAMESAPPAIPAVVLPADATELSPKAVFDWEDVTDPSLPVTYRIQVSADRGFASLVLDKEGLTNSEYTLAEQEKLPSAEKEAPYYWRVRAIDRAGNESEWSMPSSFHVLSLSVPAALLPEVLSQADAQVHFDWGDVTGSSLPVTYRIQVSADPELTSLVLDKEGLTNSEYTLAEQEKLPSAEKEAPYYWRVRAIDRAGNESEWSIPQPFYVKSGFQLDPRLLYALVALGVVVVLFIGFLLRRRATHAHQ
ncbi:IPT/TIG domain-containing protein [Chloroflexota bacterium]